MNAIVRYGNFIKSSLEEHPLRARKMIQAGLCLESIRTAHFPDRRMPAAYRELNAMAVKSVRNAFAHPQSCAWTNLFTPVEILQCFDVNCLSIEALSSFLSGFTCENWLIDYAERIGMAPTLCSYHKNFIGAADSGLVPNPAFAVTTSMICDGNINTFRHITEKKQIPAYVIDVPDTYSADSVAYVTSQLQELIALLEKTLGRRFDIDRLREILERENASHKVYLDFLKKRRTKFYPTTLTIQMYMLFASHLNIGSEETLHFYRHLLTDIDNYPDFDGKRILWVHLLPFYQDTLKQYFNFSRNYQIQALDMNLDYMEPLDCSRPLEALAEKMLRNVYNGPYERKISFVRQLADDVGADGIIHFCHWGCKQASGGAMLLKEAMKKEGIPMLILDGDGIDRRNSHDGQIKTRLEAFFEILESDGCQTMKNQKEKL